MKKNRKDKKEVINDPDVKQFLEAHRAELTNATIDEDLNVLQEYKDQQKHYDGHKFADCPNFVRGMCLSYMLIITELKYAIYNAHVKSSTTKNALKLS